MRSQASSTAPGSELGCPDLGTSDGPLLGAVSVRGILLERADRSVGTVSFHAAQRRKAFSALAELAEA